MRMLSQLSVIGLVAALSFGAAGAPGQRSPKTKPAASAREERGSLPERRAATKPTEKTKPRPARTDDESAETASPAKPSDKRTAVKKKGAEKKTPGKKPSAEKSARADNDPGAEKSSGADKQRAQAKPPSSERGAKTSPRLRAEPEVPAPPARGSVRRGNPYLDIPERSVAESKKAFVYANLSDEEALAELTRRNIPFVTARPPMAGVRTPVRLTGPLHGVTIRSTLPPAQRRTTLFEILDARLAIALDDFCALLARHDIVELVHFTMYRPPGELPSNYGAPLTRHPGGLAIDLGALRKRDGNLLAVGPHWPSNIGAKTCGPGAEQLWERPGRELLSIVCEASDEGLFHYILTPRFDSAHGDHLHLEIKPDTRWFLVN